MKTHLFLLPSAIVLAACSGTMDHPGAGSSTASVQTASGGNAALVTGTWAFVLDASDPAKAIRQSCTAKSGGDASRAEACYAEIRAEGATEKIRITTDATGRSVWRSFGEKGGTEELFLQVPLELSSDGPTRVVGRVVGSPIGAQAVTAAKGLPLGTLMRFEVIDADTIAMVDPEKGRLVFRRE